MALTKKPARQHPFRKVSGFLETLHPLLFEERDRDWSEKCHAALNGQAAKEVQKVALKVRRKYGAFFTGTELGERLLALGAEEMDADACYDPACGMGDLLLARARRLPLGKTPEQTLVSWGKHIFGTDLHPEFVEGAKKRLMLLARNRHGPKSVLHPSRTNYFPHLKVADGLVERSAFKRAKLILMNPPFGVVKAPPCCTWAGGKVTQAAVFVIEALKRVKTGTKFLIILPEVLRSGAFSEKWRCQVSKLADVCVVEPYGIFDNTADVDVFLLKLIKRGVKDSRNRLEWPSTTPARKNTVADSFSVHVGRVVPHRDKKIGHFHPYIHARCVPVWSIMRTFSEFRKHSGPPFKTPFVVIRRTSRPEHQYRAAATIVAGKKPVHVENHLIVCEPKDGKLSTCRKLMAQLKGERVNDFMNARIRCRHLTVGAVGGAPFRK